MTSKFMTDPIRVLVKRDEITLEGIKQARRFPPTHTRLALPIFHRNGRFSCSGPHVLAGMPPRLTVLFPPPSAAALISSRESSRRAPLSPTPTHLPTHAAQHHPHPRLNSSAKSICRCTPCLDACARACLGGGWGRWQFFVAVEREEWKFDTLCDLYDTLTITQVPSPSASTRTHTSRYITSRYGTIRCVTFRYVTIRFARAVRPLRRPHRHPGAPACNSPQSDTRRQHCNTFLMQACHGSSSRWVASFRSRCSTSTTPPPSSWQPLHRCPPPSACRPDSPIIRRCHCCQMAPHGTPPPLPSVCLRDPSVICHCRRRRLLENASAAEMRWAGGDRLQHEAQG
jgi:hypothetical protein